MNKEDQRVGYYAALATTILTIITFAIAIFTPPLSGPLCTGTCYAYPFLDTASRFPRDYFWMYPAMALMVSYFVLLVAIYRYAPTEKKVYGLIGMFLGFGATLILLLNYFIQLTVIQPSLLLGEADGIALLSQFNSHGIFIALDELGFTLMSASFLFLAPIFRSGDKLHRKIFWVFTSSFILTALLFALISYTYGVFREYRFEVAVISIVWLTLIFTGGCFVKLFKNISAK